MIPSFFSSNEQDLHSLPDSEIQKKSKFKVFNDEVTSIINAFDKTKDWPDLIKLLQKLHKSIKKHMGKCPVLPQPYSISKRLSQCLNPKLPAGVHKQTLICYEAIFECLIESDRLPKSFGILFSGIFSFFPLATIQIKPLILKIFRTHILPLDENLLSPILLGLISSLIIALEEDVVEFQVAANQFVNDLRIHIGDDLFLQSLFDSMLNSSRVRIPGFKYLETFYKNSQMEEHDVSESLVQDRKRLALNMLLSSMRDDQVMAQRVALEFVSTHFPIDTNIFNVQEKVSILTTIFPLLSKKDVSLSRRVFKWMFAGKMYSEEIFNSSGKEVHIEAFKTIFKRIYTDNTSARQPFQILLTILEKIPEGKELEYVEPFLLDILYFLHTHSMGITSHQDILKSAICVFEKIEVHSVWNKLFELVSKSKNIEDEESLKLLDLIGSISNLLPESSEHSQQLLNCFLECLHFKILYLDNNNNELIKLETDLNLRFRSISTCIFLIKTSITKLQLNIEILSKIISKIENILNDYIKNLLSNVDQKERGPVIEIFTDLTLFLSLLLDKRIQLNESDEKESEYSNYGASYHSQADPPQFFKIIFDCCFHNNPAITVHAISMFLGYISNDKLGLTNIQRNYILFDTEYPMKIAQRIWNMLIPQMSESHYEIVRFFYQLYCLNPTPCNTLIGKSFYSYSLKEKIEAHTKFSLMWRLMDSHGITKRAFDDGVLRMLESIKSDHSSLRLVGRSWLLDSCVNVSRILDPLFHNMLDQQKLMNSSQEANSCDGVFDESRSRFVLNLLEQIVNVLPQKKFLTHCLNTKLTEDVKENFLNHIHKTKSDDQNPAWERFPLINIEVDNYFSLLILTCLKLIDVSTPEINNSTSFDSNYYRSISTDGSEIEFTEAIMKETLRTNSVILLRTILSDLHDKHETIIIAAKISESILLHLQKAIRNYDSVFQVEILSLLRVILSILNSATKLDSISQNLDSSQAPIIHVVHSTHFLPTLLQGIQVANQAQTSQSLHSLSLLTYWVNHIIYTLPFLHTSLPSVVTAIVPTLCDIIKENAIAGVDSIRSQGILVSLHGISMLTQFCIIHSEQEKPNIEPASRNSSSDAVLAPFKFIPGVSNVTDFISNVFTQETQENNIIVSPTYEAKQFLLSELSSIIETLIMVWKAIKSRQNSTHSLLSISHIARQSIENAIIQFLEPLTKKFGQEFVSSLVAMWERIHPESTYTLQYQQHELDVHVVDILNHLTTIKPELMINLLSKILLGAKTNKNIKEVVVLHFLYNYLRKCIISDKAQGVSQYLVNLFRISLGNSSDIFILNTLLFILHCFVQRFPTFDDRRIHMPFKEVTQRLLESCLQTCVKEMLFKQSAGKSNSSAANISIHDSSVQLLRNLSSLTIEILLKVFEDRENIISLVQAMMQPLVAILKNHQLENIIRHKEAVILLNTFKSHNILHLRAVRKELLESMVEAHFFEIDPNTLILYKSIFSEIIKEVTFQDILSKFQRQVGTLLLGRDLEIISRGRNIKRLAFLFFASKKDEYISLLHPVMEKLVDSLKISNNHPHIMVNTIFCIRVLFARFSPTNFSEFWPLIISIVMQLFGSSSTLTQPDVLLEAIKLIDYALICQAEPFQSFKWIFLSHPDLTIPNPKFESEKQFIPMINGLNISSTVFSEEGDLIPPFEDIPKGYDDMDLRKPITNLGKDAERLKKAINLIKSHERYEFLCSSSQVDHSEIDKALARDFCEFSNEDLEEILRTDKLYERIHDSIMNNSPIYQEEYLIQREIESDDLDSQWISIEKSSPISLLGSPQSIKENSL